MRLPWYDLVAVIVAANLLFLIIQFARMERESRRLQWQELEKAVRNIREMCEKHDWVITKVDFRPGWIYGRGEITYQRGGDTFTGEITVDARGTTREAGRVLAKGIR